MPEGWKAEFAAQTVDNPHDKGDSSWTRAQTAAVTRLFAQYSGSLGRYHGGMCMSPNATLPTCTSLGDHSLDPEKGITNMDSLSAQGQPDSPISQGMARALASQRPTCVTPPSGTLGRGASAWCEWRQTDGGGKRRDLPR